MAVLLSSNADQFSKGLERAARSIDKFGSSVGRLKGAVMAPLESIAEKARDVLSAIPLVGGAFAAIPVTGAGFVAWLRQGMGEIASLAKESQRLNVSLEAMAGLQLLAGGSAEALEKGLFKMSKQLGDAASGGKEAQAMFQGLGLDADKLAAMPLDKALGVVSDKFLSLHSSAERAYLAFQLFGKTGFELLPILTRGGASIEQMIQKAKGLGLAFNQTDVSGVIRAERAFHQLDAAMKGIQRQAAIAFAPILGAAAEEFDKFFANKEGFRDFWQGVAQAAGQGLATALEWLDAVIVKLKEAGAWVKEMIDDYHSLKDLGPSLAGSAANALPFPFNLAPGVLGGGAQAAAGVSKEKGFLQDTVDKLRNPAAYGAAFDFFKKFGDGSLGAARDAAQLSAAQEKLDNEAVELAQSLQGQIEAFGKGAEAAKIWKLEQEGANDALLKTSRALLQQRDSLKLMDEMRKSAQALGKELASPLETFEAKIEELQTYLAEGLIDAETYARGAAKAFEAIAPKDADVRAPGALAQGSSAAVSAVTMAIARGNDRDGRNPQQRVEQVLKDQLRVQREEAADAKRTADAIGNIFVRGIG
jgi:hypothetical protein